MNKSRLDWLIRKKLRIKNRDTLPFTGWVHSSRQHLIGLFSDAGFTYGAEVGVADGRNARRMFRTIGGLKLLLVDPWRAYNRCNQVRCDARLEGCHRRLDKYNERAVFMQMTSMEAARQVEDGSLDFVYIDGLHEFDPVIMDIIAWSNKVKPGGIVSGHDYYHFYQAGVIGAVNAYTAAHSVFPWYITRDVPPSWFWVK